MRRVLKFQKGEEQLEFNKDISDYLLTGSKYQLYDLEVFIDSEKSLTELCQFINKVQNLSMLNFKNI
jgi:hypothetical protein